MGVLIDLARYREGRNALTHDVVADDQDMTLGRPRDRDAVVVMFDSRRRDDDAPANGTN